MDQHYSLPLVSIYSMITLMATAMTMLMIVAILMIVLMTVAILITMVMIVAMNMTMTHMAGYLSSENDSLIYQPSHSMLTTTSTFLIIYNN